jgi:hypothetical protein
MGKSWYLVLCDHAEVLDSGTSVKPLSRVSFETSFDSKKPKLEPNLASALPETKRLLVVSLLCLPKQRVSVFRLNRNKQKSDQNSLIESLFLYFFIKFRVFPVCFETVSFGCFASTPKQRVSMFRLNRKNRRATKTV